MVKNYSYRMTSDRGFAPNVEYNICTLSGCKAVIERCAEKGSWIIGIGGNDTGKPNRLIYTMKVKENLPYSKFKKNYPTKHNIYSRLKKLGIGIHGSNVLVSEQFYYFGDNAIELDDDLKHIIKHEWGCKCILDEDINKLIKFLSNKGYKHFGIFGQPNNSESPKKSKKC